MIRNGKSPANPKLSCALTRKESFGLREEVGTVFQARVKTPPPLPPDVINQPDYARRSKRLAEQKAATQKAGRSWPSTWDTFQKPVLYSVKLIR